MMKRRETLRLRYDVSRVESYVAQHDLPLRNGYSVVHISLSTFMDVIVAIHICLFNLHIYTYFIRNNEMSRFILLKLYILINLY